MSRPLPTRRGPFRADQIRPGDPYELSQGHAIQAMGTGGRGARANLVGGFVLDSDPDVDEAGIDAGYAPSPETLRAPDISVGNVPDEPGWIRGAPPLAVEYADTGQDARELEVKIAELFEAGTRLVWIVHLVGPKRVEIREPREPVRVAGPGDQLEAPGILRNPVPVEALYDRATAHDVSLRNLLQRRGYRDLDDVRGESLRDGIFGVLEARGIELDEAARDALAGCTDPGQLRRWLARAATAERLHQIFD